jgi:hypothetical protein
VQFESFLQVGQRLFFGFTLAGNVYFNALRHVPVTFAPERRSKGSLRNTIVFGDPKAGVT